MNISFLALLVGGGTFAGALTVFATLWYATERKTILGKDVAPSAVLRPASTTPMVRLLASVTAPSEREVLLQSQHRLTQAGFRGRAALAQWFAIRGAMTIGLPVLAWFFLRPTSSLGLSIVGLTAAAAGYAIPAAVVSVMRTRRQRRIRRAVPNLLDMLVMCLDAGLGIQVALEHVARELQTVAPELAFEIQTVHAELSAGIPRQESFRHLVRRTGVDEINSLVNLLGSVDRFGAGVADSLRGHAQMTRTRRTIYAEKRAAKASPALTITMVAFILPALFVVLLGPSVVHLGAWVAPHAHWGTR